MGEGRSIHPKKPRRFNNIVFPSSFPELSQIFQRLRLLFQPGGAEVSTQLLTLAQIAEMLQISYARAAELARLGLIPTVRLGRQIRISREQLAKFIDGGGQPLAGGWRRRA